MNRSKLFTHRDLIRLGFVIPDPNHECLLLESINSEYIWRINRLLSKMLTNKEINTLADKSDQGIRDYIIAKYPGCIDRFQAIKEELEEEIRQKRKIILTKKRLNLIFHDSDDPMT